MLRALVEGVRISVKRFAGALKLKYEYARRAQYGFLCRSHDLSPNVPCSRKRFTRRLLTNLLGATACLVVAAQPAFPREGQPIPSGQTQTGSDASIPQPPAKKSVAVPEGASGMTIYIDPETGAFLKEPAPGHEPLQLTPQLQNALSTSDSGLVEVPSPVPGGGVMIDLQGRFQSPLVGTIDANGKVKMQHLNETPKTGNKK